MIFTVVVDVVHGSDENLNRIGRLHVCDLAGSERLSKSKSNESKELLKETQAINTSLLTLSNVVEKVREATRTWKYDVRVLVAYTVLTS